MGRVYATAPKNSSGSQRPGAVVRAGAAGDVAECVRWAAGHGRRLSVQATGHGAAGTVGADVVLLETSGLDAIAISGGQARVGAGAAWGAVNARAEPAGMLGLSGTAPDVGVAGYTFGGGVRGGGGVGVATALELDLVPVASLHAGFLLWPVAEAERVLGAWARVTDGLPATVTTAIGLLKAPDAPIVEERLRGRRMVHLALACADDPDGATALLDALPAAAQDTFGPCDAARLGQVHLDPPAAVPAVGLGCGLMTARPGGHWRSWARPGRARTPCSGKSSSATSAPGPAPMSRAR